MLLAADGTWTLQKRRQVRRTPYSAQAGPVVGYQDRIGWIGRIILDAGGLAGCELIEADLAFQTSNVLRGVVSDTGNRIAVRDKLART